MHFELQPRRESNAVYESERCKRHAAPAGVFLARFCDILSVAQQSRGLFVTRTGDPRIGGIGKIGSLYHAEADRVSVLTARYGQLGSLRIDSPGGTTANVA